MKNDKTTIQSVLVIPYSPSTCTYYINDGERHAITYEKMNELLTSIVPSLCYPILECMSRHLPFFIDVKEKTLQKITFDEAEEIEKVRIQHRERSTKELNEFFLNSNKNPNKPLLQDLKEKMIARLSKK